MNIIDKNKLIVASRIIAKLTELVDLFDDWVSQVKANELDKASETVQKANHLRIEVKELKKEYEKLTKRSCIITKLN